MPEADGRTVAETTDREKKKPPCERCLVFSPRVTPLHGFICLFVLLLSLLRLREICRSMFLSYVCVYVLCVCAHVCRCRQRLQEAGRPRVTCSWEAPETDAGNTAERAVFQSDFHRRDKIVGPKATWFFISLPDHNPSLRAGRAGTQQELKQRQWETATC